MPDNAASFGALLRKQRKATGYSSTEKLAAALADRGIEVSGTALGQWERDEVRTPDPTALAVVEDILGTEGALARSLGASTAALPRHALRRLDEHDQRIAELERRLAALEGATNLADAVARDDWAVAAEEGGDAHTAPSPTDVSHRPKPPAYDPDNDPPA